MPDTEQIQKLKERVRLLEELVIQLAHQTPMRDPYKVYMLIRKLENME